MIYSEYSIYLNCQSETNNMPKEITPDRQWVNFDLPKKTYAALKIKALEAGFDKGVKFYIEHLCEKAVTSKK